MLTLSYAHRKLLSIYRWALARPALLLLESPDAGLDGNARNQLQRYLSQLSQEGIVILVTEHSFPVLQTQCDHILLFEDGANLTIHHRAR